jgi:serine/threonine protein kinase
MTKHLNFLAIPPHVVSSSISPKMSEIVMKMLEKEPSKRYHDAIELKEELRRLERTPSISGKEDRRYRRLEEHIQICYKSLANPAISECVFTKDICDAGIKFVTKIPIPERVILEIDISLPDYVEHPTGRKDAIKVLGRVKWISKGESMDGYEIGCEFLEVSEDDRNRLIEYIRIKSN